MKRKGYGKALLDYSLERATEMGFGAVLFEGNIDFYGKSGFAVTGVYQTPQGYYVKDEEVDEFDKGFPAKEKLKLPGQLFG